MAAFFLRGVLIGLLFGVLAGAVGAMTVQRTWIYGIKAGLFTGLGSSVADCINACVGAFGLTVISEFLLKYQAVINLAGGELILYMGFCRYAEEGFVTGGCVIIADGTLYIIDYKHGIGILYVL